MALIQDVKCSLVTAVAMAHGACDSWFRLPFMFIYWTHSVFSFFFFCRTLAMCVLNVKSATLLPNSTLISQTFYLAILMLRIRQIVTLKYKNTSSEYAASFFYLIKIAHELLCIKLLKDFVHGFFFKMLIRIYAYHSPAQQCIRTGSIETRKQMKHSWMTPYAMIVDLKRCELWLFAVRSYIMKICWMWMFGIVCKK